MFRHLTIVGLTLLAILMAFGVALAAPCVITSGNALIQHDLSGGPNTSYCELCGTGYITIIITNPYGDDDTPPAAPPYDDRTDMIDMRVVENLGSSGLTYAGSTEIRVNGTLVATPDPAVSGGNGEILTWDAAQIPSFPDLAGDSNPAVVTEMTIRFSVAPASDPEDLVVANLGIAASLTYSTVDNNGTPCPGPQPLPPVPVTDTLPLREPDPAVIKGGRNVDAAQTSYADAVYGNDQDDIIWRIRFTNNGDAELQDLVFDDVMATSDNLNINYICATEAAAESVAITGNGAIGTYPGCTDVRAFNNTINNYDVDDPYGYDDPGSDLIDVLRAAPADIFLVGKFRNSSSGRGACSTARVNTVNDVEWGCQAQSPPGGIDRTSTGAPLADETATLSGWWNPDTSATDLSISVAYLGNTGGGPAGAKGRVQITITNPMDSTVTDLWLRNTLPPEYVVDATRPVTIAATGVFGFYPGLTNEINWDNEDSDPLLNTVPEFTLTSSLATNSGQRNLLRNGDELIITFGIILVRPESYDEQADLDVVEESPSDSTDPDHATDLSNLENTVMVRYGNFCTGSTTTDTDTSYHTPNPEDLDVQFSGGELVFILTQDPAQRLPLTVDLINRGGHDAEDYTAYVAFGQTMDVVTVPGGCSLTSAPRTFEEWQDPSGYPTGAAIYACTGGAIAPGATSSYGFEVIKSSNPAEILADDLTFRADVFGEITDYDGNLLTYPDINTLPRGDGGSVRANNYSLDALRARVVGFNLIKSQVGNCSENNNPLPADPDRQVQIGEECTYRIDTGGWFGFQTPGWTFISVQDIELVDELPDGQGWLRSDDSAAPSTTAAIQGIRRSPSGLTALDEGWVTWNFNDPTHPTAPGPAITVADHWFRREMDTRFLNDPVDTSALPNQHAAGSTNTLNSTFDATFEDSVSGFTVTHTLGQGTIGYPIVAVRQITMAITEPELTVVKEVCNETLYGAGPTCSNWVTLADDGDALNDYIYRLTVTNALTSGGFTHAPAYDVTVTDTLDISDLAYVLPFASDGLNNDGDSATDGADAGGEGSIINNEFPPNGTTPAVITFSSTHSNALLRINPGDSVQLYYRVDFDDDAAPLQTFTNGAYATYDSLEWTAAQGDSGMQTAPLRPNSDIGGARVYTSATANADVRIIPIETQPKRIVDLSSTALAGSGTQGVSIGEEIEYRLNTLLPVALLRSFVVRDELPAGITCEEAPAVDLGPSGPHAAAGFTPGGVITPTCNDTLVEWNFGDQRVTAGTAGLGNRYDFEIGFIARVANTAGNNDGDTISNGAPATTAYARYVDQLSATITQNFNRVDVEVNEPLIALTKAFAVANADAADVLTITVTATNNGTAAAYNLRVMDDLTGGSGLTYVGNVGGANPPDTIDTSVANRPIFSWSAPNGIDPAATVSFTFEVLVDSTVQPHQIMANTIEADWTSLPAQTTALNSSGSIGVDGAMDGMRIGALPNAGDAINDYETTASDDVVVPVLVLTKTDLNATVVPAIGVRKQFQVDIALPEGITNSLVVTDTLNNAGLSYVLENNGTYDIAYSLQGIESINGNTTLDEGALAGFPADGTTGSAVWNFGTVVTQTENDPSTNTVTPLIRITYFARINNDADTDAGDALQNSVEVNYVNGETSATESLVDTTPVVTVVEPELALNKTVTKIAGTDLGGPVEGGDTLRYTLTFTASGGGAGDIFSDAFDLIIYDSLSPGLQYVGNPLVSGAGNIIGAPDTTGDGSASAPMTIRWPGLVADPAGTDINIPEGTTVTVTYDVNVLSSVVNPDDLLENSARAHWTSLDGVIDGERDGTGDPWLPSPGDAFNDYYTGPAATLVVVGDDSTTTKSRNSDTYGVNGDDDQVRIGDLITYQVQFSMLSLTLDDAFVVDTLPRGLQFEDIVSINGDDTAPYVDGGDFIYSSDIPATAISVTPSVAAAATGPTTLTIALPSLLTNDSGGTAIFTIIYRARVLNNDVHAHVDNIALTNSAAMGYTFDLDPVNPPPPAVVTTLNDEETVNVRQPNLSVAKSAVPADGSVLAASQVVTYTVDITNNGTAPAYDAVLRDIIPIGMRNGAATITMDSISLVVAGSTLSNLAPSYDAGTGIAIWDFDSGTANEYTIPAGDTLRIVYEAQADATLGPGMTLTNAAQVQLYYSFDDDAPPSGDPGRVDEREEYGPSNTASVTFTTDAPGSDSLTKENPAVLTAAIGQPFTYRITVPTTAQSTALNDVRILDDLGASAADLSFIRVAKVSGSGPWTPTETSGTTSLEIEDTTTGIDIPASQFPPEERAVVDVTVRLDDSATNVSLMTFTNTASYSYNQVNGDDTTIQAGGEDTTPPMTIVGPDTLIMNKTGPATMSVGTPAGFVLDIFNNSSGAAWNPTIVDHLPDDATNGGTCGAGPSNVTVQYLDDGAPPVATVLTAGTDYTVIFDPGTCTWTLQLLSVAGPLEPNHNLVVNYETTLDADSLNGAPLTNVAGATQWYSYDPDAADAAPRTYTRTITDGTVGVDDHEDAHTVNTEAPVLTFVKNVRNVSTGQDPGLNAVPGNTLHYTIEVTNSGPAGIADFTIVDEVDDLNSPALFVPGSLVVTNAGGGVDATSPLGGANGTGLVNITNLSIDAAGGANDTVVVEFEVTLVPVITSGTVVLNQAELVWANPTNLLSDDPNVGGSADPTETLISSQFSFQVQKISTDLTDDPAVLMAGDTLRYTLTIKNIGDENAINTRLRDLTPANTAYVANSTTLNGTALIDPSPGVSPLNTGILINAPEDLTPGAMRADTAPGANNVATVTFDVVVDPAAMDGLIIENQGFVSSEGTGSGTQPEQPSDDPDTAVPDDPTRDVVGNVPLLYAHKTVVLSVDNNSNGFVDPGDGLRYSIEIRNTGAIPATGVTLTDAVPVFTTYVANSIRLNGGALPPDGGVSPLIAGLSVQSSDNPGAGIISAAESAVLIFDVTVNFGAPFGAVISNQGDLTSNELPPGLTDADGLPANGFQPTVIVVGNAQLLTITKAVAVVGGGAALAGGQLEYTIRVTNPGSVPATQLVITDDLGPPLDAQVTYVPGSGTLDGVAAGVTYAGNILTADYAATYGDLPPGSTAILRFRVQISGTIAIGTTITNTGVVNWNSPSQTDSASVSIDVGGTPGSAVLNGNVWHDVNLNVTRDSGEQLLAGWAVSLYHNGSIAVTTTTDASGIYQFSGLVPNDATTDQYELRYIALGGGVNSAAVGYADSVFTDGPHRISDIVVASGSNLQDLNLPIQPNGTVYNSVVRTPVIGATLTLRNAASGAAVADQCLDDPNQQNQVTVDQGFYKFDMNFSHSSCPAGGAYLIEVNQPATGYRAGVSQIIPPESDASTAAFSVPACPGSAADAVPATADYCETVTFPAVPPVAVPPRTAGTRYHLHLMLSNGSMPGESQIYNNPIPLDPEMAGFTAITKTASKRNVSRGALVPYTITVTNVVGAPLYDIDITDTFPAGFKYLAGSARLNGVASEPQVVGRQLIWDGLELQVNASIVIKLLLVVGSGVSEGEYINRAQVSNTAIGDTISGEANASVQVVPDPDFDCTDIIGKVFNDANLDGQQDNGEKGLAGVRVVTVRGLIATTDVHGRFHITCAAVPDQDRGSNFILKLDERSLPSGYRLTTENPRVQRATRGKMMKFNFGATIHSVVRIDIAEGAFQPDTSDLRIQWAGKMDQLIQALKQGPSVLRLSYLGDVESKALVKRRLKALKQRIKKQWKEIDGGYPLTIETEIFWRRGASFNKR